MNRSRMTTSSVLIMIAECWMNRWSAAKWRRKMENGRAKMNDSRWRTIKLEREKRMTRPNKTNRTDWWNARRRVEANNYVGNLNESFRLENWKWNAQKSEKSTKDKNGKDSLTNYHGRKESSLSFILASCLANLQSSGMQIWEISPRFLYKSSKIADWDRRVEKWEKK